jgi:hypothetical protein
MSSPRTKLTVQQTVWPWDRPLISPESADAARKRRAFIQFCAMNIVASLMVVVSKSSHLWLPLTIYALSILVAIGGYFVPPLFEAFERFGMFLAKIVGAALTYILLVPFFFLCFVPARFILQAMGKDPLRRKWSKESATYWTDKQAPGGVERYKRQF